MNFLQAAQDARARIHNRVRLTPLEHSAELSRVTHANVLLKLENYQLTGSFKLRGAVNKVLSLSETERAKGVIAASSGNHGAGVAQALAWTKTPGLIYVPENASPAKIDAIRRLGARVETVGATCEQAEQAARLLSAQTGQVFISPYNDDAVIAGQATIALEIAEQFREPLDAIFVSVGGGGLISGVAGVMKALYPAIRVYGCSPETDCAMAASLRAGKIVTVDARPTLSDGTAGAVEDGSRTFGYCRDLIDEFVLVTEVEIKRAMRTLIGDHHMLVEGAAAVAVAALLKQSASLVDKKVAILLCGANISLATLKAALGD